MALSYLTLVVLFLFAVLFLAFLVAVIAVTGEENTKRKAIDALQGIAAKLNSLMKILGS